MKKEADPQPKPTPRTYLITRLPPRNLPRLKLMRERQSKREEEKRERQELNARMFEWFNG